MKKLRFLSILAAVVAFASCSKSDDGLQNLSGDVFSATFNAQAPATKATVSGLTRYIVEAYEGKDLEATPQRVESNTGSLTVTLKNNTEYTFVFWADDGVPNSKAEDSQDYFDADDLKAVKVNDFTTITVAKPAYYAKLEFNSDDFEANKAVVLGNATAQLNFVESAGLTQAYNALKVTYPSSGTFNVATGIITEDNTPVTRIYTGIGQINKDATLVTDYVLTSAADKRLLDLEVQLNSEPAKSITNVPLQCNYKTNIKGEFSNFYASAFTISSEIMNYIDREQPLLPPVIKTITIEGVDFDFVLVKAGTFQMGTPSGTNVPAKETPCNVRITQDYYIGITEVTQAQYVAIMGTNPSSLQGNDNLPADGETQEKRPVEQVSWDELNTPNTGFLAKMNALDAVSAEGSVRLPSEAQWEYAARGGHKATAFVKWPGTDTEDYVGYYAWTSNNSGDITHEVGKKFPNILGLYDMAGNVIEWCSSYYMDKYPTSPDPLIDPDEITTGTERVIRGGCYNRSANLCRSAYRSSTLPSYRFSIIGFRLVLTPR